MMKMFCNVCNKYRKSKNPKRGHEYTKIFKDKESTEILKFLGLITNIEEYQKIYNHF